MVNRYSYVAALFGLFFSSILGAQPPVFGREIRVAINGYSLDAMEPALSADGNALFFNSLNDGITTSLYYAARVTDSTFDFAGPVPIVNQTVTPHLDGVVSLDSVNNFYWVSTRQYPSNPYNLHRIRFLTSGYSNFGRVYGDFYHVGSGWIIMDASITYQGDRLLYCNAFFDNCSSNTPCKSTIGIAEKINDSTFNKLSNSVGVFDAVNDTTDYAIYAPHLSMNGLELYYSRLHKTALRTEVLVSTRQATDSPFQSGHLIDDDTLSEGPVLSTGGDKLYYHKKTGNKFNLVLRYRQHTTGLVEESSLTQLQIFPNPTNNIIRSSLGTPFDVYNILGEKLLYAESGTADLSNFSQGVYLICDLKTRAVLKLIKR